jgi:putative tricarboxylic transport membrane protein
LLETPEWKKELDTNFWQADYRNGAGFRKILDEDNAELTRFLDDIGLVAKK